MRSIAFISHFHLTRKVCFPMERHNYHRGKNFAVANHKFRERLRHLLRLLPYAAVNFEDWVPVLCPHSTLSCCQLSRKHEFRVNIIHFKLKIK